MHFMKTIGAYEAKTQLPQLLNEAARGNRIMITKNGVPIAMLVPARTGNREPDETIAKIRAFRAGKTLGALSLKEMIEEGRRF